MKIFLLLNLILFSFQLCGQSLTKEEAYANWQESSFSFEERSFWLQQYCSKIRYTYPDSALALIENQLSLAKNLQEPNVIADLTIYKGTIYYHLGKMEEYQKSMAEGFATATEHRSEDVLSAYYLNLGFEQMDLGDINAAISSFRKSIDFDPYDPADIRSESHNVLHNLAMCYRQIENLDKAVEYYQESLAIRMARKDTTAMMYSYINLGSLLTDLEKPDSSKYYFNRALDFSIETGDAMVEGYAWINLGTQADVAEDYKRAFECFGKARDAFERCEMQSMYSYSFLAESLSAVDLGDFNRAIELAHMYVDTATPPSNLKFLGRKFKSLYKAHKGLANYDSSLFYYERKRQLDEMYNTADAAAQLADFEAEKAALLDSLSAAKEREILQAQHEVEVAKKNTQRNIFILIGALVLAVAAVIILLLRKAKNKSEEILDNVLPSEISDELKEKGFTKAKKIPHSTILFSDFKGFTALSEQLGPEALVEEIHTCFQAFDAITSKYDIEKIKTIGDSYMAAGGLADPDLAKPDEVIQAAIAMQTFMVDRLAKLKAEGKIGFEMRLGIHSGPVVAGVVGVKKYQYDIWGDTVNTASRMESSGESGKVNISEATYQLVKDNPEFIFTSRGKIAVKGKGELDMYFVDLA